MNYSRAEIATETPKDAANMEQIIRGLMAMAQMQLEESYGGLNLSEVIKVSTDSNTISSFEERLERINSPLDAEYADLKQTMKFTTEFFAFYLDVKIGQDTE